MCSPRRILFVHHSIGRGIIKNGDLRRLLGPQWEVWDHDYNRISLAGPDGQLRGVTFPVPRDNTDPSGLLELVSSLMSNSLRHVPEFDLLMLKSCYPNNLISSDEELDELIGCYRKLRMQCGQLPFQTVLLTTPPAAKRRTSRADAARAIRLNTWLNQEWPDLQQGLTVVDLFSLLSSREGWLKPEFQRLLPWDSHPNLKGYQVSASVIRDHLVV